MPDKRLEIAFDAGVAGLNRQNDTLSNIRTRASGVLGVAAVVTSFAGGLGLIHSNTSRGGTFPRWAALALMGVLVVIGTLVVAVQWPIRSWGYGVHPGLVIEAYDKGDDEDVLRKDFTLKMTEAMGENEVHLTKRLRLYQAAVGSLVAEVLVFALALISQ